MGTRPSTAPRPSPAAGRTASQRGFTLLELMIVTTVIAVIAAIGVPQYRAALRTARFTKARQELMMLSQQIDTFLVNENRLPLTLYEVGQGGRRDPWGVPYCFLNYDAGTGDGLEWALAAGLVNPSSIADTSTSAPTIGRPTGGAAATGGAGTGLGGIYDYAALNMGSGDIAALEESLASGVRTSIYTSVPVEDVRRRDQYLFPLNTDYDLFSLGPNGASAVALNDPLAIDDVIRANNGGFFGVAADY